METSHKCPLREPRRIIGVSLAGIKLTVLHLKFTPTSKWYPLLCHFQEVTLEIQACLPVNVPENSVSNVTVAQSIQEFHLYPVLGNTSFAFLTVLLTTKSLSILTNLSKPWSLYSHLQTSATTCNWSVSPDVSQNRQSICPCAILLLKHRSPALP